MRSIDQMIKGQLVSRGIHDKRVLKAIRKIPRHEFVPSELRGQAYEDSALSIGHGATISQPYIVALMTQEARISKTDTVLEIGTGSGYQTAILAELAKQVFSVEIDQSLSIAAQERVKRLGYNNVKFKGGDGYKGWIEHAPYNVIIVTAAPAYVPTELANQLAQGGRMIIPVGTVLQNLLRVTQTDDGLKEESLLAVSFIPLKLQNAGV